jgi:argininosuccinate lyase
MSDKLWDGRFSEETDQSVEAFTSSIRVDKRLYVYDIEGSIAHCRMLSRTGIITDEEAETLIRGLGKIREEIEEKTFRFDDRLEDIHMHIEARLIQEAGPVARKLHTARSRNDQVALDLRMYLRDETAGIVHRLVELRKAIVNFAKDRIAVIMPGYTHLQRAQPVLLSHHLMAYYEMFSRDTHRFQDCLKRINVMPLGSAALAGTTFPIDREFIAELLGFPAISCNSMDSVSDRDFVIEFLSAASICMMHFSRLSEELILWSSAEFGFVELPDAFTTGSSIMPQKKNPDVPELVRGKSGRVFGNLMALLTIMKSLPLSYNRDMQEDKEPLFDTVDTLKGCIHIFIQIFPRLIVNEKTMKEAAAQGYLNATDLADYLAGKGMPFREAHACAGNVVGYALSQKKEIHDLDIQELKSFSSLISEDVFDLLTLEQMVNRRKSAGGTATQNVSAAIKQAESLLEEEFNTLRRTKANEKSL